MSEVDGATSTSKTRQLILHLLSTQALSVKELAKKLSMEPLAIRHHIRVLKNSGAVEEWEHKRGKVGRPIIKYRAVQVPANQTIATEAHWFYSFFQRPISTIVRRRLFTVGKEATILDAAEIMRDNGIGSMIIMDDANKEVVGIVTERDIVNKVAARNLMPLDVKVERIMTSPVITIQETAEIAEALESMAKYRIRRLLVLRDKEPLGLVTQENIIDAFVLEGGIRTFKEKSISPRTKLNQLEESSFMPETSKE
ncbi:MAG: CBS domain-containing protein [Thaumarchaeota archaeon]|nr:CBS domain-containing protein [Nitrososphaerota archaeon]MCL5316943.1 CBS domain-containing protein [Nitrososphaerota archaeon]